MKARTFAITLAISLLALAATAVSYAAVCTTTTVTEASIKRQAENTQPTGPWVLYTRNAGTGAFRQGPGTPSAGVGSFEMVTPTGADKAYLFNYEYIGTKLSEIDNLRYATYRTAGTDQQVTALNIEVDVNGSAPGGFTTLVFEPVYNSGQGAVVDGVWQPWDAYNGGNGIWWSTKNIPGTCAFQCYSTWHDIVAANPDAVIVGGLGLNQGSGNPGLTSAVDYLTVGTSGDCITYNFDPYAVAATKDDCKNGGYTKVKDAQGNPFKNQGQCVSFVESNRGGNK